MSRWFTPSPLTDHMAHQIHEDAKKTLEQDAANHQKILYEQREQIFDDLEEYKRRIKDELKKEIMADVMDFVNALLEENKAGLVTH